MIANRFRFAVQCVAGAGSVLFAAAVVSAAPRPNVLVILADDLGYHDVGFQGCTDIPTPHLDRLAARSVRCTSGYVSHPFCSPTRAGLLTGRYQQRFGHENNPAWLPDSTVAGLPLSQTTVAQVLASAGYATGCIGKWHLGAHPQFHPNRRGFAHYFGLLGGGHIYLPGERGGIEYTIPLDRNGRPEPLDDYLTDILGREAAAFIRTPRQSQPWFLYLAFNAPHTPLQSPERILNRVPGIPDELRQKYAGLVIGLDDAVGVVLQALRESAQEDNTLVFFLSDNGGPVSVSHSDNAPLRGAKGQVYEGGIRVPFLVSWPARLTGGRSYDQPVSSLDIFPTATAAAEADVPAGVTLDGVNLLPCLAGEKPEVPQRQLFWRTGGGDLLAIREGNWKWLQAKGASAELYDLSRDVGETRNLAEDHPNVVAELERAVANWNRELIAPLFESPRAAGKKAKK
jgi:arylsulfatase A-like enzyme